MNLDVERSEGVAVVHVREPRLIYPLLGDFSSTVTSLITGGERKILVDFTGVGYVDSATIGCLMDLYRQSQTAGATLKLSGVHKRVETMLAMTGARNFLEVHEDVAGAIRSFAG